MYKIALQLYGKSRFLDFQLRYWYSLKKLFKEQNIELDIHITTWKDDYSQKFKNNKIFTNFNLEEYPKKGYVNNKYEEDYNKIYQRMETNEKSSCLFLAHYSLYKSYSNRKKWQYSNNIEYDFIICMRIDYHIYLNELINFCIDKIKNKDEYVIHIGTIQSFMYKENYPLNSGEDNCFYGTQQAIDLFCTSFNYLYRQNHNYYLTHHTNYSIASKLLNQIIGHKPYGLIVRSNEPHKQEGKKISYQEFKLIEILSNDQQ